MMLNSKSIGNKIAEARKKNNLSQNELAQQVAISAQAVGKWERGESMPDITKLNRLAEILGVDLNYFSENFSSDLTEKEVVPKLSKSSYENDFFEDRPNIGLNWDMSQGNWVDADFSGLKNIQEQFKSSNLKNCKFLSSELSGIIFKGNNIESCDFSRSDLRNSKIHASSVAKNVFAACNLIDTEFKNCDIRNCNFSSADFSGAEFVASSFQNNSIDDTTWKHTSFKEAGLVDVIFEGNLEDCSFENCYFKGVKFQNAVLTNTFFKHNRKLSRVQFIDCKVDNLTYAFLKNGQANMSGVTLLD